MNHLLNLHIFYTLKATFTLKNSNLNLTFYLHLRPSFNYLTVLSVDFTLRKKANPNENVFFIFLFFYLLFRQEIQTQFYHIDSENSLNNIS